MFRIRWFLLLLFFNLALSQDSFLGYQHPVYEYLRYLESSNRLKGVLPDERPLLKSQILKFLDAIDREQLNDREKSLLEYYRHQLWYPGKGGEGVIQTPLRSFQDFRAGLRNLWHFDLRTKKLHLFSYSDSTMFVALNWSEMVRWEGYGERDRRIESDVLFFQGEFPGGLLWGSEVIRFREFHPIEDLPPEEYKQPFRQPQKGAGYLNWDETHGYLFYPGRFFQVGFFRWPLIWGVSDENSMILSGNASAFPYFYLKSAYKSVNFTYFHGELTARPDSIDEKNGFKYVGKKYYTSHRVEVSLLERLHLSAGEIIVYSRESPEMAYFLPLLWYKQLEHNLRNRDNLLIFIEGKLILPWIGKFYGSLLLDEFAISRLRTNWWGNKYGIQVGLSRGWQLIRLPLFTRLELTLIRPWVYSHEWTVTTYIHADRGLGYPRGPNSVTLSFFQDIWFGPRLMLHLESHYWAKGSPRNDNLPVGSYPDDIYLERDRNYDFDTPIINGVINTYRNLRVELRFQFSNTLRLVTRFDYLDQRRIGKNQLSLEVDFDY